MVDFHVALPGFGRGLSAKLLVLSICFVMIGEILIYVPSIARFRLDWLENKIAVSHLAILALEATPNYMIDPELESKLLDQAGVLLVAMHMPEGKNLIMQSNVPLPIVEATIDITMPDFFGAIRDAFTTFSQKKGRIIRIIGPVLESPNSWVDVLIDEMPLRQAMIAFSWRILGLSIVISFITASLIFVAMQWLMIWPMRRLTYAMIQFRQSPEDPLPSMLGLGRRDEFGVAEQEFLALRSEVVRALHQKEHLAALGTAIAKINHDLRGILASAQLVADRLSDSGDPKVQKMVPPLMRSLDRALSLSTDILDFSREGKTQIKITDIRLPTLCEEIKESVASLLGDTKKLHCAIGSDFSVCADRDHLFRVLRNLVENALQVTAQNITITASHQETRVEIDICDDGPGLPPKALENLFVPFKGSARVGGSGLGLATSRELMRAQGGDLILVENSDKGARFRILLPKRSKG